MIDLLTAGSVKLPGQLSSNSDAGAELGRIDTDESGGPPSPAWATLYEFRAFGTGTIAVVVNARTNFGGVFTPTTNGSIRIARNNATVVGAATTAGASLSSAYAEVAFVDIAVDAISDTFQVQVQGGTEIETFPDVVIHDVSVTVDWVSNRATWNLTQFF